MSVIPKRAIPYKAEIEILKKRISELEAENTFLKSTMNAVASDEPKKEKSDEELICESQLKMLREESAYRALTLEETKRMDLVVKNLILARSKKAPKNPMKNIGVSDEELMNIANTDD